MTSTQDAPGQQPYPGLRPYQENEQGNFFGRDADAEILLDKLLANRLTLLFAASGVGKSSLLNAAVLPHLKDPFGENLTVVSHNEWFVQPVEALTEVIRQQVPQAKEYQGENTLPELLSFCTLFTRPPLVLVLDQFEEFFRYQRGTEAFQQLIEQLTQIILNPELPVNVVISMREDFALELNAFKPRLPTLLFENYYRLERLGKTSARKAIETPLQTFGYHYETELLDALLEDLAKREREGERLPHESRDKGDSIEPPYLQIVCSRLWELNKDNPDKSLTLASYEKAGRDEGILSHFLERALSRFSHAEKHIASKAFDYLAARRGVKMAYPIDMLAKVTGVKEARLKPVLKKLESSQVRILTSRERLGITWYELYHDLFSASIERWNNAWKEKQLRRQRWVIGSGLVVTLAITALLIDSFLWIQRNYFPANYLFQEQKFRLMNWGLLPEPLPEMVDIPLPDGEIRIGELNDQHGQALTEWIKAQNAWQQQNFGYPTATVKINEAFAMSRYEVTYEQYDYYVWQQRKAGLSKDDIIYPTGATRNNGRGNRAVTQVSWDEAMAYTQWLSDKTGKTYRLPTEAEWEYAARGGTETAYWWGDDTEWGEETDDKNLANCDGCGSDWDNQFIAPAGQFKANPFGLYDTAGNVWEWTCSEWQVEFDGSEQKCANEENSSRRVLRGGSWFNTTVWLRSSARYWSYTFYRIDNVGFRILRLPRTP